MSENKKRFLPAEVGMNQKGNTYAFHLEGFISRNPYFKAADEDKDAYLGTAMGITHTPDDLMKQAEGQGFAPAGNGFVTLNIFGALAEQFSKTCVVGLHVAVSGRMEWHDYTNKAGEAAKDLRILVDQLVVMGSKTVEPVINSTVGIGTSVYIGKDSVRRCLPLACLLTGTVIGAKNLKTSDKGTVYLSFGLKTKISAEKVKAMVNGTYDKDKEYDSKKKIVNCTVFGKRAEALAKVVQNGAEFVVSGPMDAREYNGQTYIEMRPRVASLMKFAPRTDSSVDSSANTPAPSAAGSAAPAGSVSEQMNEDYSGFVQMDEDDEELPF